jgi:hypothetical protein
MKSFRAEPLGDKIQKPHSYEKTTFQASKTLTKNCNNAPRSKALPACRQAGNPFVCFVLTLNLLRPSLRGGGALQGLHWAKGRHFNFQLAKGGIPSYTFYYKGFEDSRVLGFECKEFLAPWILDPLNPNR